MEQYDVYVSKHAKERIKERYGTKSEKKIQRLCNMAYVRGATADSSKGKLKEWIKIKSRPGTKISCFNEYAFVFSMDAECITVLNIPPVIKKNMHKMVVTA